MKIDFYFAVNPTETSLLREVDCCYFPEGTTKRKIINYFKKRNPKWDFKKKVSIAKII